MIIKLKTCVSYNGTRYKPGETIEVSEKDASHLIKSGSGEEYISPETPDQFKGIKVADLKESAKKLEIEGCSNMSKQELLLAIIKKVIKGDEVESK